MSHEIARRAHDAITRGWEDEAWPDLVELVDGGGDAQDLHDYVTLLERRMKGHWRDLREALNEYEAETPDGPDPLDLSKAWREDRALGER